MIKAWVVFSACAALFQTIRTALQKRLRAHLSTNTVNFTRYFYGWPIAVLYLCLLTNILDTPVPHIHAEFLRYCFLGGFTQIIGTSLLIKLFSYKNFIVSTTYAKTEALQAALIGMLFFSEKLSALGFLAVIMGIIGVFFISLAKESPAVLTKKISNTFLTKQNLVGIGCGFFFAVAVLFIRKASLSLDTDSFLVAAAMTLAVITIIQALSMGLYLQLRERKQWPKLIKNWKISSLVGVTSIGGSICWFTALTLATAAYVKTVGQIEMIFALFISLFIFHEKVKKEEIAGVIFIVLSILLLLNTK